MVICGLQKLSMVDYPGKLAATVFTGGCNLRCPFCHNALLVTRLPENQERHTMDEVLDFLNSRRGLLDGVVLSGGEPLLQDGVAAFARSVHEMGFSFKLDTNGTFPDQLAALLGSGLVDYVAMDIKNSPARYAETVGIPEMDLAPIEKSIHLLCTSTIPYEFRTTLVREFHTKEDILAIGAWLRGASRYCLQTFVDSGNLIGQGLHAFSADEMRSFASLAGQFLDQVKIRGID